MNTKQILSLAVIATLPLSVHADPTVGPAAVPTNGTPVVATASAPYVTQTPTADDATHIASTAYVKGAYNDAIAAVNKVNSEKQDKLMNMESTPHVISNNVVSSATVDTVGTLFSGDPGAVAVAAEAISSVTGTAADNTLVTTGAVFKLINDAATTISNDTLDNTLDAIVSSERIVAAVYTTWEDDNAKAPVALFWPF